MEGINEICKMFFKESNEKADADYLAFLAKKVPKDLDEQLQCDGAPDLSASKEIDVTDLMRPLSSLAFPTDKLGEFNSIMEYIVISLGTSILEYPNSDDPYKVIYAASLYIYCNLCGPNALETQVYFDALAILASICIRLDLETRLQVIRFLGAFVPIMRSELDKMALPISKHHNDYVPVALAPLSSILIAMSVIVSSILNDLSLAAENTMKSERIRFAWSKEETATNTTYELIAILRQLIFEMYGISGKVRQSADRFLPALEEVQSERDITDFQGEKERRNNSE